MIIQLDQENNDYDLTSQQTILTATPDTSNAMLCQSYVQFGDGTKNLDGSGGSFELTISVGGQTIQPDPQSITFSTAVRSGVWTIQFPVPANTEIIIKAKSPNAGDSDVDVTATLYQVCAVDVRAISGDSTAADNLESACDNYTATRGLAGTALPNADADAAGGLPISDAGGLDMDAILVDTDVTIPGLISALNNISASEVNAEVSDVIKVDTIPELPIAQPDATPTLEKAIMLLYMALRNQNITNSTENQIHNDAGDIIAKASASESLNVFTKSKYVSG